jgi:hypothetical protein
MSEIVGFYRLWIPLKNTSDYGRIRIQMNEKRKKYKKMLLVTNLGGRTRMCSFLR